MSKASESELEFHKKIAKQCFNQTWDFLEKKNRTPEDDRQMLLLAHASRYHWGLVGNARNLAVGEWQISRAYADLKQAEPALLFAKSSLDLCVKNDLTDLLVSAYEGLARAYAVAKQPQVARDFIAKARRELESIKDQEDKKIYGDQITETEALIPSK
jgi:hypothetical protein